MKSYRRARLLPAAMLAVLALALAACGSAGSSGSPENAIDGLGRSVELAENFNSDAHFTYVGSYPPSSFDPNTSASGLDQTYLAPIYDRLLYNSPKGELEPMLAERFEVEGSTIVLTLRPDLTFTDGAPFDSHAVKTNLDRYMADGSTLRPEVAHITAVSAREPLVVEIQTDGSVGATLATLSARAGMMVSPKAIEAGDVETNPAGIGPYTATRVTPGQGVQLTKTDNYWEPSVQRVATMELKGVGENQTRQNALASGETLAAEVEVPTIDALGDAAEFVVGPTPLVYFFAVNTAEPAFKDPRVLEAINLAIDRSRIAQGLFEGACEPQVQLWPSNSFAYNKDIGAGLDRLPYDPDRARDLLEEAGFADAPSGFDTVHTNNTTSTQLGEVLQSQLAEVGVSVNPAPVPSGGIVENFGISKSMPATLSGYTGAPDPDAFIQRNLTLESVYNPGGWESEQVTRLSVDGAKATDQDSRAEIYHELAETLLDEPSHVVPICAMKRVVGFDPSVSNLHSGGDYQDLRGVAVAE
ncbi:peptide/nickel transport system substrate-binding protein [Tamaricihabitans halophyticus]|uniref:Peptide/nickel transport system substrate-binding protein n=1 Tax=Tamaricihabitans halophyticus TaxID=1262583 RepID=A0A4R2Q874_9PSEU|nr:ABC transporter substrate-binding protein [Tamaricihabitans halophyticus]TCP45042.1 peptide/nickel transport system substrate-binding protein [Tamaricihabitans halophyticus]